MTGLACPDAHETRHTPSRHRSFGSELANGHADASDEHTDVYALGCVLALLTRRPDGLATAPPLAAVIARARATAPDDRYPTVTMLVADVDRYRAGDPVRAYREGPLEWTSQMVAKHQTAVLLVAAYVVIRVCWLSDDEPAENRVRTVSTNH
jgi:hypothetical protein